MPQDDKVAIEWYRLAAELGHANALYSLGFMFTNGEGVPQDFDEAAKWYRLAAEQGHIGAQLNLGAMYFTGTGVLKSYEDAYAWWVAAAVNGNEDARNNMEIAQEQMTPKQIERGQQIAKEIQARLGN